MNQFAAVISAVAATIAAFLAGLNVYLSGRNEDKKWARGALIDTFTSFLDASFRSKDAVKEAIRMMRSGAPSDELDGLRQQAVEAETEMQVLQTRLRLLASKEVVDAAQALRGAVKRHIEILERTPEAAIAADKDLRQKLWHHREQLINAAKKALSI